MTDTTPAIGHFCVNTKVAGHLFCNCIGCPCGLKNGLCAGCGYPRG